MADTATGAAPDDQSRIPFFRRIGRGIARFWRKLYPRNPVRRGAAAGVAAVAAVFLIFFGWFTRPGLPGILDHLSGVLVSALAALLVGLAAALLLQVLKGLPRFVGRGGLVVWIVLMLLMTAVGVPVSVSLPLSLLFGTAGAFFGGGLAALRDRDFKFARTTAKLWALARVLLPAALFLAAGMWMRGRGDASHLRELEPRPADVAALGLDNPGRPGPFRVLTLTYGSGTDRHRPEYGTEADLITEPVDASPFLKDNKGWTMKLRRWYWGFDMTSFPVNGRVWRPEGTGPFPLVLCVHGNHRMQEFSDPGYAYLGELLASRGFIFVSVDENFFNGGFPGGLSKENDGRGWMLLQHLKVWREWNRTPGHAFFGLADMSNIGLIGHSRGGEAAAVAGMFNRLSRYPDDASVTFDFHFGIKAIAAIAPSDQQYRPAGRPNPLDNVNYLVLQGAHDSDVSIFAGARQYQRVAFTDGRYWFKSSIYSYRSNHGQFNTVWGDNDWGEPMGFLINRRALLDGEDQRSLAKVVLSAFLEAALHGESGYLPLFRDPRAAAAWLPPDIYISRFMDSSFRPVCDYEEDADVTTGSEPGVRLSGQNLAVWREADLAFRKGNTKQNHVAYLGWRGGAVERGGDAGPAYSVLLPEEFATPAGLTPGALLVFSLADSGEMPPGSDNGRQEEGNEPGAEGRDLVPLELDIELVDAAGTAARLPLERFNLVPPVLNSRFTRLPNESGMMGKSFEPALRTFELPLEKFREEVPEFDPLLLRRIRFVFERGREGVIVLDGIGFARPDPGVPGRPPRDR